MLDFGQSLINSNLRKVLKRLHYPLEVMLVCAINLHGLPENITLDKSGSNTAAIRSFNVDACVDVELRQSKHLNNIVEQDHRAVKRITSAMLGFKSLWSAQKLIAGIETMHRVKTGKLHCPSGQPMSAADQFDSLAI
jgi:putative transposase